MGITNLLSDLYESVTSSFTTEAHAEEPQEVEDSGAEEPEEASEEKAEAEGEEEAAEGGEEEEAEAEEEEEEEEEEAEDLKPKFEEECARSSQCHAVKHHFDECVERVTAQHEDPNHKGHKEDCVEEFFHLQHCATECAAPKLWRALK